MFVRLAPLLAASLACPALLWAPMVSCTCLLNPLRISNIDNSKSAEPTPGRRILQQQQQQQQHQEEWKEYSVAAPGEAGRVFPDEATEGLPVSFAFVTLA